LKVALKITGNYIKLDRDITN